MSAVPQPRLGGETPQTLIPQTLIPQPYTPTLCLCWRVKPIECRSRAVRTGCASRPPACRAHWDAGQLARGVQHCTYAVLYAYQPRACRTYRVSTVWCNAGDLGFKTRAQMSKQFCDIAFVEEPGRVYGPIETKDSMHLMYLHSCRGGDDFKEDTSVSES